MNIFVMDGKCMEIMMVIILLLLFINIVFSIYKIKHYHLYHDVATWDVDHNFSLTGVVIVVVVKIIQG